jgi:membrane protein DedA with SNARE-associated domain
VQRTQNIFARHGTRGLFMAKFVPGLSMLAPPLAGTSGVKFSRFLLFDATASAVYCRGIVFLGVLFKDQMERVLGLVRSFGVSAVANCWWIAGSVRWQQIYPAPTGFRGVGYGPNYRAFEENSRGNDAMK